MAGDERIWLPSLPRHRISPSWRPSAYTCPSSEPQQALSAAEALRLFTSDAARLQFEESEKGALRAGLRADLVLLSANPLAVAPTRISGIRVLRTVSGGRVVHDAGEG